MNIWREVGRRFVVWLVMVSVTVGALIWLGRPLEHMPLERLLGFLGQAFVIGSLTLVGLSYFTVRLNHENISRGMLAFWLLGLYVFPEYVWDPMSRVFGGIEPTISAMLVMLLVTVVLNVGLVLADRSARAGRGRSPS